MSEQIANLLIVEDEPITRSQLTSHFEKEGYCVISSENAVGVIDQVGNANIDACLIDINLPGKRWPDSDP